MTIFGGNTARKTTKQTQKPSTYSISPYIITIWFLLALSVPVWSAVPTDIYCMGKPNGESCNPGDCGVIPCACVDETCICMGFKGPELRCGDDTACKSESMCTGDSYQCPAQYAINDGAICGTVNDCAAEKCISGSCDVVYFTGQICRDQTSCTKAPATCVSGNVNCPPSPNRVDGTICAGVYDCAEYQCTNGACGLVYFASGTQCGTPATDCLNAAVCSGASTSCPSPTMKANGISCGSSYVCGGYRCYNGVCTLQYYAGTTCSDATNCKNAAVCVNGNTACPSPTNKANGFPCGESLVCGREICSAGACIMDYYSGNVCEAATVCYNAAVCDGVSTDCPTRSYNNGQVTGCNTNYECGHKECSSGSCNTVYDSGNVCDAATTCYNAAVCDGVSTYCPTRSYNNGQVTGCNTNYECGHKECSSGSCNTVLDSGNTCEAATTCYNAAVCDGVSTDCPTRSYNNGQVTGCNTNYECGHKECSSGSCNTVLDSGNTCEAATVCYNAAVCDGVSTDCPTRSYNNGQVTGCNTNYECGHKECSSGSCNTVYDSGNVCDAATTCYNAAVCNGVSTECPTRSYCNGASCTGCVGSYTCGRKWCSSGSCGYDYYTSECESATTCYNAAYCPGNSKYCPDRSYCNGASCTGCIGSYTCGRKWCSSGSCGYDYYTTLCEGGDLCKNDAYCSGSDINCPPRADKSNGFICGANTFCGKQWCQSGSCDWSYTLSSTICEDGNSCKNDAYCTGDSNVCPPRDNKANGLPCGTSGTCGAMKCTDGECQWDYATAGTQCLEETTCLYASQCTGSDHICPPRSNKPDNTICGTTGICGNEKCTSGVCGWIYVTIGTQCEAGDLCKNDALCTGSDHTCPTRVDKDDGTVCGTVGDCGTQKCTSGSCDWDYVTSGTICLAGDVCKNNALCTGSDHTCPSRDLKADGTICGTTGICGNEKCTSGVCGWIYLTSGHVCEAGDGCHDDAVCSGDVHTCPSRALKADNTICGSSDECGAERCTSGACGMIYTPGISCGGAATSCTLQSTCVGGNSACPSASHKDDETICGIENTCGKQWCQSGVCEWSYTSDSTVCETGDLCKNDSYCPGDSHVCPPRNIKADGTICGTTGVCGNEKCTSGECGWIYVTIGTQCEAGDLCKNDALCDGVTHTCPSRVNKADDTICGTVGKCGTEKCSSGSCDWDYVTSGTICLAGDVCKNNALCTGSDHTCPPRDNKADNTICGTTGICGNEKCTSGVCGWIYVTVGTQCEAGDSCKNAALCDGVTHTCPSRVDKADDTICGTVGDCGSEKCTSGSCGWIYELDSTVCRSAAGPCDSDIYCIGSDHMCPNTTVVVCTATPSPTVAFTPTVSPTPTTSPTPSSSPTVSLSPSPSPTPTAMPCTAGYWEESFGVCVACEKGKWSSSVGATNVGTCQPCPIGEFSASDGTSVCSICDPGYFQDRSGQSACIPCPQGAYQASNGSSSCAPCMAGRYSTTPTATSSNVCDNECPAGTWSSSIGASSIETCVKCEPGQWSTTIAATSNVCAYCLAGKWTSSTGLSACLGCNEGTFSNAPGQSICANCPAGYYNNATAQINCTGCPIGQFSSSPGSLGCTECPAGYYADSTGTSACTPCPQDHKATIVGAESDSVCIPCALGEYAAPGATACGTCSAGTYDHPTLGCVDCAPGTFSLGGVVSCDPCPTGSWTGTHKSSVCTQCGAGKFSTVEGSSRLSDCQNCPAGQYSGVSVASVCSSCAAGKYSTNEAATSDATCVDCGAGSWSSVEGAGSPATCQECDAGWFGSVLGATSNSTCNKCDAGKFSSTTGSSNCTACSAGKYGSISGLSVCTSCEAGKWNNATSATDCNECAAGKYSSTVGASTINFCIDCPAGHWSSVEAASTLGMCAACIKGQWSSNAGATSCSNCDAGEYASVTGSTECTTCPAGKWNGSPGASICKNCVAGKYLSSSGATYIGACTDCPAGRWSNIEGASRLSFCTKCAAGRWSTALGASSSTICTKCDVGHFQSVTGSIECDECATGKFTSALGRSECDSCTPGTWNGVTGQSSCAGCTSGMFSSNTGATICDDCYYGSYANGTGNSVCTQCSPGYWNNVTRDIDCDACPFGQFASVTAARECIVCPAGYYAASTGTSACTPCPQNYYSNDTEATSNASCIACPVGQFSAPGASECGTCPPGTYDDPVSSCTPCPIGRYSMGGVSVCPQCPGGSWTATNGTSVCTSCGSGMYSNVVGSSLLADCQPCPAGRYSGQEVASVCANCHAGTYNSLTGQTSVAACTECVSGYWSSQDDQSSVSTCVGCVAGTWSTDAGATTSAICKPCGVGRWSSAVGLGTSACTACMPGTYSPASGATTSGTCQGCSAGKWSSVYAASSDATCQDCDAGKYSLSAAPICSNCPGGTWSDDIGVSTCVGCVGGKYSPALGATNITTCQDCAADTFSTGRAAVCTDCEYGLFSHAGWDECLPKDCLGVIGGSAIIDPCGVCNGTGDCFGIKGRNMEGSLYLLRTTELGGSAQLAVSLNKNPSLADADQVVVSVGFDDSTEGCCPSPASLTFTTANWATEQTVTVKGAPDATNTDGDVPYNVRLTASGGWFTGKTKYVPAINKNVVFPSILSFNPPRLPLSGMTVTVTGEDIQNGAQFFFGSARSLIPASNVTWVSSSKAKILVPGASLGYHPIIVSNPGSLGGNASCPSSFYGGIAHSQSYPSCVPDDELYYDDNCPIANTWGKGAKCKPCPWFAICPGGNRIWPKPGFWSPSAQVEPIPCPVKASCMGGRKSSCNVGYAGQFCADCAKEYYRDGPFCTACTAGGEEATLLFTVAVLFFLGLSAAVMLLSDDLLDLSAALLVPIQQIANIGLIMGDSLYPEIREMFRILSLLSFEFDFIKPGCTIGTITFAVLFYITLGMMVAVAALFLLASLGRGYLYTRWVKAKRWMIAHGYMKGMDEKHEENPDIASSKSIFMGIFTRRLIRSISILFAILYLSVSTRIFQSIYCVDVNTDPNAKADTRLYAEMSTKCFKGDHLYVGALGWFLMIVYVVGFPYYVFFILYKNRSVLGDKETRQKYGFLYRGLHIRSFWYRIIQFIVNAAMSAERSFGLSDMQRASTTTVVFMMSLLCVLVARPFKDWWRNLSEAAAGCFQVSLTLTLLAGIGGSSMTVFAILLAVFIVEIVVMGLWTAYKKRKNEKRKERMRKDNYVRQFHETQSSPHESVNSNVSRQSSGDPSGGQPELSPIPGSVLTLPPIIQPTVQRPIGELRSTAPLRIPRAVRQAQLARRMANRPTAGFRHFAPLK